MLRSLAIALLLAVPTAASAQGDCITPAEGRAVVTHLLPSLLDSVERRCAPVLGADAFLSRDAGQLARRLTPQSERNWPAARVALERQFGTRLPESGPLVELGRMAITDGLAKDMDAQACEVADGLLRELAPLPPRNLANVVTILVEAGLENDPDADLRICPTP